MTDNVAQALARLVDITDHDAQEGTVIWPVNLLINRICRANGPHPDDLHAAIEVAVERNIVHRAKGPRGADVVTWVGRNGEGDEL